MIAQAVSAAALLRAGARVFLGWGPREDPMLTSEPPESPVERTAAIPVLIGVAASAIALGLVASVVPGLEARTEHGADVFRDHAGYVARVLNGETPARPPRLPFTLEAATGTSLAYAAGALVLAVALAAFGLWYRRLPRAALDTAARVVAAPAHILRVAHSGIIGDYVLWLAAGTVLLGGVWAFSLR
jgi:multicomponent Na+:H+ antiporter subunit D